MDVMHYFRFYNKCWGQVMNLAPTFIIEPFSLSRQFGSAGGVSFFLFFQQGIGRYLKCYAAHTKGGFDPDAAESGNTSSRFRTSCIGTLREEESVRRPENPGIFADFSV